MTSKKSESVRSKGLIEQDTLPVTMLKLMVDEIKDTLNHFINESIRKLILPEQWKIFNTGPIPKTKNSIELSDYELISILLTLLKIY